MKTVIRPMTTALTSCRTINGWAAARTLYIDVSTRSEANRASCPQSPKPLVSWSLQGVRSVLVTRRAAQRRTLVTGKVASRRHVGALDFVRYKGDLQICVREVFCVTHNAGALGNVLDASHTYGLWVGLNHFLA